MLDQVRERIRYKHYSLRTEEAYVYWVRGFIRFHNMKHPKDMGVAEVTAFLSWLAAERGVAPSTHKQALSALLFLYREVLEVDLPWMNEIFRPKDRVRVPTVLSVGEVARLFDALEGPMAVLGRLLYGTGLRLMEALRLRIKYLDFERREIVVRAGKGDKDRRVMLPDSLAAPLKEQPGARPVDLVARPRARITWRIHARCAGSKISKGRSAMDLVLGLAGT